MIKLKNLDVLNVHSVLKDVYEYVIENFEDVDIITSAFRPGDSGVHGTFELRGLDVRCRDTRKGLMICDCVNDRWKYDPIRPELKVAIYHNAGSGVHLHLQTHPNTIRLQQE